MKFELLDRFIEQKEKANAAATELARREQEAYQEYLSLKTQYEQLIQKSVLEGKDATKELDKLAEQIDKAKKAYERRQQERAVFAVNNPFLNEITSDDVVRAWNEEFVPAFRKEKVEPALEQLLAAKKAFVDAVFNYYSVIDEFEREQAACRSELSQSYYYKLKDVKLQTQDEVNKYFITDFDLRQLARREMPQSLKY
jgi:lysophospholipase L1-like esterase